MKNQIPAALAAVSILVCNVHAGCGEGAGGIEAVQGLGGSDFWVSDINIHGHMAGFSYLPGDVGAQAFIYTENGIQALGTLGGAGSQANAINAQGHIVGQSDLGGWDSHAFLYADGTMLDLGTLGGFYSTAVDINDDGLIAGWSTTADGFIEAFVCQDTNLFGLGSLGGGISMATAINSRGQVIGDSHNGYDYHAFLFDGEHMIDLGDLGGGASFALAINDSGVVVGEAAVANGNRHAFMWADGVMIDLGTLGGTYSRALDVNEAGQVIGTWLTATGLTHGFIYANGTMTDLGTLGGSESNPRAINNLGQVVGSSTTSEGLLHAFAWQNGVMIDLNSLLASDTDWELTSAEFINEAGHIVGYGHYRGVYSWFRISPGSQNSTPVAIANGDLTVECGTAVVLDGSRSIDPDGDALTYQWSTPNGLLSTAPTFTTTFPLGTTSVVLKVTDPCGAEAQATFNVTVSDTTPPSFTTVPENLTAAANANCQAAVPDLTTQVAAVDSCSGSVAFSQSPAAGTLLGLGVHAITVSATDDSGNTTSAIVTLSVDDKTAPTIHSLSVTPSEIAVPNRQLVPVTCSVNLADSCDSAPVARIVSVTSNEALAPGEVEFTGALSALLAATRDPAGDGRVYTLVVEARDTAGNTSEATVTVTVLKGNGHGQNDKIQQQKLKKN